MITLNKKKDRNNESRLRPTIATSYIILSTLIYFGKYFYRIMALSSYSELVKSSKRDHPAYKKIKLAILADSSTQFLAKAIKGFGVENEISFEIFETDHNQVEMQVYDGSLDLYKYNPDFIIIFYSSKKVIKEFYTHDKKGKANFADEFVVKCTTIISTLNSSLQSKIIFFNIPELNDNVFGNFANKTDLSFLYQAKKINLELMKLAHNNASLFILDLNSLQSFYGLPFSFDPKIYVTTDSVLSLDILPAVSKNIMDIIKAINGSFKKCVIVDLDNITWGGVIGDDGIEGIQIGELGIGKAFTEFQLWIRELVRRGVILAICSKNDEAIAKEPFLKHPEMILRMEDVSVFVANWENKVDNILYIQQVLNIDFDSIVFLDDTPFERNQVKNAIPGITVPDLPEDPADYVQFLSELNLFETSSINEDDEKRTRKYQEESQRIEFKKTFANEDGYLETLNMSSEVKPFNKFTIPRIAQLTQRSNQFNLRTIRYTEDDVAKISGSDKYVTFSFTLKDIFGDHGLVSSIILKKEKENLFIDTWIMSCRVLKRGLEEFAMNTIIDYAKSAGYSNLVGEYIPTKKNMLVKDHYQKLGFVINGSYWHFPIQAAFPFHTNIKKSI